MVQVLRHAYVGPATREPPSTVPTCHACTKKISSELTHPDGGKPWRSQTNGKYAAGVIFARAQ